MIEKVSQGVRGMFKRLKHFEAPDGTVLSIGFHSLDWRKGVTYVYIWFAQWGGVSMPRGLTNKLHD